MTQHQAGYQASHSDSRSGRSYRNIMAGGALVAAFFMALPPQAGYSQDEKPAPAPLDPAAVERLLSLHLAYVTSPSEQLNQDTEKGLKNLAAVMIKRTSISPEGVAGVSLESDDLSPFPFIYWPVTRETQPLSEKAQKKLQAFMNNGGVVVIDVCDNSFSLGNANAIRRIIGAVGTRPLTALPEEHTLKRAFYLVSSLPGSSDFGTVWVESPDPRRKENVTSVVIGENNWASAWAGKTLSAGSEEHEKSLRSGVNMIVFSLTGNYKADQVHIPALLERLER